MPSRLKDLRLRFPYDDQDFREKYTPGYVSPSSLKYTGDESKGPRASNASLKNNHPVFIFPHHDSDGSQNLFYVRRRTYLFTRSIEPRSIARHWRFCQENIHWNQHIYAAWPSDWSPVGLPSGLRGSVKKTEPSRKRKESAESNQKRLWKYRADV